MGRGREERIKVREEGTYSTDIKTTMGNFNQLLVNLFKTWWTADSRELLKYIQKKIKGVTEQGETELLTEHIPPHPLHLSVSPCHSAISTQSQTKRFWTGFLSKVKCTPERKVGGDFLVCLRIQLPDRPPTRLLPFPVRSECASKMSSQGDLYQYAADNSRGEMEPGDLNSW